ncbi:hypothetical protein RRG08_053586 [Elysia crispata]|uniref:Uncharacterized protein n=1 Tax=Elysia crispata TaxID=231223 RepID=A0AAE0Y1R3_9GAST|nr:hypothetical protein RRG08_053586 [Elysia crispata]
MCPYWTWAITVRLIQLQVLSTSQDSLHVSILDMGNNRPSDPAPGVINHSRCCQPVKTLYMCPYWTWAITVRLIQLQVLSTSQDSQHVSILDIGNNRPFDPAPGVMNQSRLSTCIHLGHGQ